MISTNSRKETWRRFKAKFGREVNLHTISAIMKKWKAVGSIQNQHKGNSGRKKSARSQENQEKIMSLVVEDNKKSIRRLAFASDMKKSSVHNILRKDLHLKPYKPQTCQELKEGDESKRLEFCLKIREMIQNDEVCPGNIIFSDESHVYLKGSPNKQNNREWCVSRPADRTSVPLHSSKVTVWCGLSSAKVYGPFFFEDRETGAPLTVTKERYVDVLKEAFPEDDEDDQSSIFMQDGAPAHTSRMAMDWLQMRFPGRLISNKSDFVWPPRSPDLNPCDFFLWGYMKQDIHRAQPGSTEDVKQKIREFMAEISEDLLQRVNNQFMSRVGRCIAANGGLFE